MTRCGEQRNAHRIENSSLRPLSCGRDRGTINEYLRFCIQLSLDTMKPTVPASLKLATLLFALLATPALAQDAVRTFGVGSGANDVGRPFTGEGSEFDGPQAIYAGRSGEIFLLDQVNGRILNFDGKDSASPTRSLSLPDDMEPSDMIVTDSNIVVWTGRPVALEASGTGLTRSLAVSRDLSAASDEAILSMFGQEAVADPAQAGTAGPTVTRAIGKKQETLPANTVRKAIVTRGAGAVTAVFTADTTRTAMEISVISKATQARLSQLKLRTRDRLGTVDLLEIDDLGRAYVLVEAIPDKGAQGQVFVARFAQSSAYEGTYSIPLSPDMTLVRRFVTVSPEGDVYFLRSRQGEVDILAVGFTPVVNTAEKAPAEKGGKGAKSKLKQPEIQYTEPPLALRGTPPVEATNLRSVIAAVGPLTRQRVIDTAFAFESIRWQVTSRNYGSDPDTQCSGFDRIRRPWYLRGAVGSEARGVPYCWGCSGSLATFERRIAQGAVAGNVCTRDAPRRAFAGVDCSAFVSATWGLSVHFTTAMIPTISTPIDPWSMKPGDVLNKPNSHVMLFIGYTADRRVQVIESATGGCNGRVCRNVYSLGSLLARGYVPRRYRGLEGDQTSTVAQPGGVLAGNKERASKARTN